MRPLTLVGLVMALLVGIVPQARAGQGLYCLHGDAGIHCVYASFTACMAAAAGSHGECKLNQNGMLKPVGGAPYCIAEKWRVHCIYPSMESCMVQAMARRAQCVPNPNQH
ncbi:hypothetical protein Mmc1_0255 [Magnetococcus marinus MC-1]|uniref:DUF3551 domain-containing protein n=1 Tax=Magnetococcus marinus (strain ATCC BAA-1437 / JCM 17883 / MC-1) TaxID=156889 RepID=A0L489_MAGMM|nr:DUF3551 domain-containing protein [Magnetococcus marinus]ABK42782.1 hypothetical protein Mmc1_0255 [Magnetococcus marinus MC-1]